MTMPRRNQFDGLYGVNPETELGFINFGKLKKWVKKTGKKVGNVAKKVVSAPIKAIRKVGKDIDLDFVQATKWTGGKIKENPGLALGLAAGGAALTLGGGPLIAAGIKGAAGMAKTGAAMVGGAAKAAAPAVASKIASRIRDKRAPMRESAVTEPHSGMSNEELYQAAYQQASQKYSQQAGEQVEEYKERLKKEAQAEVQKYKEYYENQANELAKQGQKEGENPKFQEVVQKLKAQGYTDKQIAQQWMTSQQYYKQAVPQVQKTVYPQVYEEYRQKMPANQARAQAIADSQYVADKTVSNIQRTAATPDWMKYALPAGIVGALFLLK